MVDSPQVESMPEPLQPESELVDMPADVTESADEKSAAGDGVREFTAREKLQSLIGVFVLVDVFAIPLAATGSGAGLMAALFMAAAITVLVAQFALLATWGVLAPQSLPVRLAVSMSAATGLYLVSALGIVGVRSSGEGVAAIFITAMMVPLAVLVVQAPIWAVRALFDWGRFDESGEEALGATASRQFGLREMLVLMAVVAATLGLMRAFVGLMEPHTYAPNHEAYVRGMWLGMLSLCGAMLGLSTCGVLPCLAACLAAPNTRAGQGALAVYWVVLVIVATMLIVGLAGAPPGFAFPVVLFWAVVFGVFLLAVGGSLAVVRSAGYRLVRRRRGEQLRQGASTAGSPFALEPAEADATGDPFA